MILPFPSSSSHSANSLQVLPVFPPKQMPILSQFFLSSSESKSQLFLLKWLLEPPNWTPCYNLPQLQSNNGDQIMFLILLKTLQCFPMAPRIKSNFFHDVYGARPAPICPFTSHKDAYPPVNSYLKLLPSSFSTPCIGHLFYFIFLVWTFALEIPLSGALLHVLPSCFNFNITSSLTH